jgi:hypothetical protein
VKPTPKEESVIKAVIDGRKYPPHFYRLPNDTRQWSEQCFKRRALAMHLASYANPDGTSITLGVDTAMQEMGTSRATIFRWLDDLKELGVLKDEIDEDGRARIGQHGTRRRRIDFSVFEKQVPKVSNSSTLEVSNSSSTSQSQFSKSQSQVLEVSNSTLEVSKSVLEVSRIGETQPLQPHTPTTTTVRTAPPKAPSVKALCGVFSKTSGNVPKFKKGEKQDLAEMIIGHDPALLEAAITVYAKNPPPGQNADTIYTMSGFVDGFEKYLNDGREHIAQEARKKEEQEKRVEKMLQDPRYRERWKSSPENEREGLLKEYQDERNELHFANQRFSINGFYSLVSERFLATLTAAECTGAFRKTDKDPFESLDEYHEAQNKQNALIKRGKAWDAANPEPEMYGEPF